MKKQFLILMFLSLAFLFAGTSISYGQPNDGTYSPIIADGVPTGYQDTLSTGSPSCAPVTPLACMDSIYELKPQPGVEYTYTVTTSDGPDNSTPDRIHWFVVANEPQLIEVLNDISGHSGSIDPGDGTGTFISATDYAAIYNIPTQTSNTIDITWKSFDGVTNIVLLVAYVVDASGCTDNIEVYRIKPEFGFTLDMAPLLADGSIVDTSSTTASDCVSPIESALWNGTAAGEPGDGTLTVDYGENWVFFSVTAANFAHSWMPEIVATYSGAATPVVQWAYPDEANSNDAGNWHAITDPVLAQDTSVVGPDGQCIVLRVQIDHGTDEENAENIVQTINVTIDGIMYDANATSGQEYANTDLADLNDESCDAVEDDDYANYLLTPRPQIISNTGAGATKAPFEQASGDVDEFGNN